MRYFILICMGCLFFYFQGFNQDVSDEYINNLDKEESPGTPAIDTSAINEKQKETNQAEISTPTPSQMASETTIRLLISHPNYSDYNVNKKVLWIAPVIEATLYFRLNAIEKVEVIPLSKVTSVVPSHRDFEKRITRSKYSEAAKELNATHLLYIEYEISSDEKVIINATIDRIGQNATKKIKTSFSTGDFDGTMRSAVNDIATAMGIYDVEMPQDFFAMNIMGKDSKNIKRLGEYLIKENNADKKGITSIAGDCEKLKNSDPGMYLASFAAITLYGQADNTEKALGILRELVDNLRNKYPKLMILLASYYRKCNKLTEAQNTIEKVTGTQKLDYAILWEKGLIYEAIKNWSVAQSNFERLAGINSADPNIYLHLAKISIALRKETEAAGYIQKVAQLSGKTEGKIYYEIGNEFLNAKDQNNAIASYRKGVESTPDFAEAWLALGNAQLGVGADSAAAECYVILYNLDYIKYGDYLEKGGKLFEKRGLIERARQVYGAAFEKFTEPKIAVILATLEFNHQNCKRVNELLVNITAPWDKDSKVLDMLAKCSQDNAPPVITLKGANPLIINAGSQKVYTDPGAVAKDDPDGDITYKMKISGEVDVAKVDTYTVTYTVSDNSKNTTTATRKVIVMDAEAPKIELKGEESVHLVVGDRYREAGYSAKDNLDGDLTRKVTTSGEVNTDVPGNYTITYSVTDKSGNTAKRERYVNIREKAAPLDKDPPKISFIGDIPEVLYVGDNFTEPGVNAVDRVDGDVTANINIEGEVDPSKPGIYHLTYTVRDKAGNNAKKTLFITVKSLEEKENASLFEPGKVLSEGSVKPHKKGKRKAVLGITTTILGLACGGFGAYTDFVLIPQRQKAYREATKENVQGKSKVLKQTVLLRNLSYAAGGVFGLTFIINLCIPQKK